MFFWHSLAADRLSAFRGLHFSLRCGKSAFGLKATDGKVCLLSALGESSGRKSPPPGSGSDSPGGGLRWGRQKAKPEERLTPPALAFFEIWRVYGRPPFLQGLAFTLRRRSKRAAPPRRRRSVSDPYHPGCRPQTRGHSSCRRRSAYAARPRRRR